ncbi:hypothetical protein LMG28140_02403 [Paraburkholderia metrosideri]|jgi:hypothetical protein|uniref:Uncharacterized protein n=1 Tax=Paraburkholderia metrosideri TaxID=580937 RepID=A0ABM8NKV2_9BURK|nr:hypothetical protein LMG28140_02403 [Paraburkholderia metrosideri]
MKTDTQRVTHCKYVMRSERTHTILMLDREDTPGRQA